MLFSGYNIILRDRVTSDHCGIYMYVRDSIRHDVLSDLMEENLEVLWVKICPKRHPRGIPSIIVGTVYHSPSATDSLILDFLSESLSKIEAIFPDCGLFLLEDFIKLNCSRLRNVFGLRQIVAFSTHGQSNLDVVLTNLSVASFRAPRSL